jgi:hypothetical protein
MILEYDTVAANLQSMGAGAVEQDGDTYRFSTLAGNFVATFDEIMGYWEVAQVNPAAISIRQKLDALTCDVEAVNEVPPKPTPPDGTWQNEHEQPPIAYGRPAPGANPFGQGFEKYVASIKEIVERAPDGAHLEAMLQLAREEDRRLFWDTVCADSPNINVKGAASEEASDHSPCKRAINLVYGDRQRDYGHPADNWGRIARYWSAYLFNRFGISVLVEPRDVGWMNILQKIARDNETEKRDNLDDTAGYAEGMHLVAEREGREASESTETPSEDRERIDISKHQPGGFTVWHLGCQSFYADRTALLRQLAKVEPANIRVHQIGLGIGTNGVLALRLLGHDVTYETGPFPAEAQEKQTCST